MKNLRWWLAIGLTSFGCGDPEYGGSSGALRLRFGLGGCTSIPASKSTLAKGGLTDLIVGDPKKRERLELQSDAPDVLAVKEPTLKLTCDGSKCEQTTGQASLEAKQEGSALITISSDGAVVDAMPVKIRPATSIRLENDQKVTGTIKGKMGTAVPISAKLFNGETELFTKGPFSWKLEGDALEATKSTSGQTGFMPKAPGSATVTATFQELSGSIQVVVDP